MTFFLKITKIRCGRHSKKQDQSSPATVLILQTNIAHAFPRQGQAPSFCWSRLEHLHLQLCGLLPRQGVLSGGACSLCNDGLWCLGSRSYQGIPKAAAQSGWSWASGISQLMAIGEGMSLA